MPWGRAASLLTPIRTRVVGMGSFSIESDARQINLELYLKLLFRLKKIFIFNSEAKILKGKTKASYAQAFSNYLEMLFTKIT